MSHTRLLSWSPTLRQIMHFDEERPDDLIVEEIERHDALLAAARRKGEGPPHKDFRHAAYIPSTVIERAFREGWFHDPVAWKKWANDPDNARFRTWSGNL